MRTLIVDDEAPARKRLNRLLADRGVDVLVGLRPVIGQEQSTVTLDQSIHRTGLDPQLLRLHLEGQSRQGVG